MIFRANFLLVLQSSTVVFYRLLVLLQVYGAHDEPALSTKLDINANLNEFVATQIKKIAENEHDEEVVGTIVVKANSSLQARVVAKSAPMYMGFVRLDGSSWQRGAGSGH